jgi:hypothetical protein
LLEQLTDLPKAEVDALIRAMAPGEANAFVYDWRYRARPEQLPPAGSWRVWLLMAGRGFGKTHCGAEWVRAEVKAGRRRIALVGRLRPTRAMLWWRANPAFWPFHPIRSARFTSQASAG